MLPILLGLIFAMLFGLMSVLVYGFDGLTQHGWLDTVFWSLILTGTGISLVNELGQCIACRLGNLLKLARFESFCTETACGK